MKHTETSPTLYCITESLQKYSGDVTEDERKHQFIFIKPYISDNEVLQRLNCHDELVEALKKTVGLVYQFAPHDSKILEWATVKKANQAIAKAEESGK